MYTDKGRVSCSFDQLVSSLPINQVKKNKKKYCHRYSVVYIYIITILEHSFNNQVLQCCKYGTGQCQGIVFDAYDNEYTVAITQSNQEFPNCPYGCSSATIIHLASSRCQFPTCNKLLLSKHRQFVAYLDCQIKKKRIEKLV